MLSKKQKGQEAELKAKLFLQSNGLSLITQNYHCYFGEIDLIMHDENNVVFIEVRSRKRSDYGLASETINKNKQAKLIKTATYFLQTQGWLNKVNSRFDVIAIQFNFSPPQLEWIKNAFSLSG